jgi:hypothetical protein
MPSADDRGQTPLETLCTLVATAREFAEQFTHDPLVERILAALSRLPEPDRETIVGIIERDATWCRIAEQTADTTGITVRPNPQASLYLHVLATQKNAPAEEPLGRDVEVIRFGLEHFVRLIPLLFQDGVHAQWTASARELIAEAEPELRQYAVRLCREVLALIDQGDGTPRRERTTRASGRARRAP